MSWIFWLQNLGMGVGGPTAPPTGPATLREAVFAALSDVDGLDDLVGDRIYYGSLPQDADRPAVTYAVAARTFGRCFAGPNRSSRARVRVSCWGDVAPASRAAELIRARLDGWRGTVGQVEFFYVNLENEIDLPEPPQEGNDRTLLQVVLDFSIRHAISPPSY